MVNQLSNFRFSSNLLANINRTRQNLLNEKSTDQVSYFPFFCTFWGGITNWMYVSRWFMNSPASTFQFPFLWLSISDSTLLVVSMKFWSMRPELLKILTKNYINRHHHDIWKILKCHNDKESQVSSSFQRNEVCDTQFFHSDVGFSISSISYDLYFHGDGDGYELKLKFFYWPICLLYSFSY